MSIIDMERAVVIADESPELFEDLFRMVIESLPEKYSNLENALATENRDQVEMYAHQFKGALRNLAATETVELLQKIENAGASGEIKTAEELYKNLPDAVDRLLTYFEDGAWKHFFPDK